MKKKKYLFLILTIYNDKQDNKHYEWKLILKPDIHCMHYYLKQYIQIKDLDPARSFIINCNFEKAGEYNFGYIIKMITNKVVPMSVTRFFTTYDKMIELSKNSNIGIDFDKMLTDSEMIGIIDNIMDCRFIPKMYKDGYDDYNMDIHDFNILNDNELSFVYKEGANIDA